MKKQEITGDKGRQKPELRGNESSQKAELVVFKGLGQAEVGKIVD